VHSVPQTETEAQVFFEVNEQGTRNLLQGLQARPPRQFIFISTVAVYGLDNGSNISEAAPLQGSSPYAQSKINAEQAVREWCQQRGIPTLILRLPLVYGPNPPGNLGDISKMIQAGRYVRIRGNKARKSIVLAKDVAKLIARVDGQSGTYNLTDGVHPRFSDLEEAIAEVHEQYIRLALPLSLLRLGAYAGDVFKKAGLPFPLYTERLNKMTATLTFDDHAAQKDLGWKPQPVLSKAASILPYS
jgi:nucleoside-diphosphate-sugar epimerase